MRRLTLGAAALTLMLGCSRDGTTDASVPTAPSASRAAAPDTPPLPGRALPGLGSNVAGPRLDCPPLAFLNNTNLAANPSFETGGPPTAWPPGPFPVPSAATGWFMHTSNDSAPVTSARVATNVPGPGGSRMLHYTSGSIEGGVYQQLANSPAKLMFSVWVRVLRGQVIVAPNGGVTGPYAWSEKVASRAAPTGEWEQLRICTDGTVPTGFFVIWNEAAGGSDFYVDRVEIRELP